MRHNDVIATSESFAMRMTSSLSFWIGLRELAGNSDGTERKTLLGCFWLWLLVNLFMTLYSCAQASERMVTLILCFSTFLHIQIGS